jgi:hypothetical protein
MAVQFFSLADLINKILMFGAFSVAGTDRKFRLPQSVFSKVVDLLRGSPEFTLTLSLLQRVGNVGSIFSLSNGSNR